jgi:hypothetical protein
MILNKLLCIYIYVFIYISIYKEKISVVRSKSEWEDNIEMDLGGIGFEGINWTHLDQVCPMMGSIIANRPDDEGSKYL